MTTNIIHFPQQFNFGFDEEEATVVLLTDHVLNVDDNDDNHQNKTYIKKYYKGILDSLSCRF